MRILIHISILIGLIGLLLFYSFHECCFQLNTTTENILIGFFTSFATVLFLNLLTAINDFIDFGWIAGNSWFEYDGLNSFENYTATVEIKYLDRNILNIKLTEKSGNIWVGVLTMNKDNKVRGQIAWNYPNLKDDTRFGLKEIIITKNTKYDFIYLMSLNFGMPHRIDANTVTPPYGNMILRRECDTTSYL